MQNEKTLEQLIREYEANMPPEIMAIVKAFDWRREMRMIVNQNQLMIDVGADIEQSIYLMIIGAVKIEDFYERLMDLHEIPEDKAKKIIQEIEVQIFNPLHKKLMELDGEEEKQEKTVSNNVISRDTILAEIEKEPEPIIKSKFNFVANPQQTDESEPAEDSGIAKPFSIVTPKKETPSETLPSENKIIEGIQNDPVAAGLQKSTIVQTRAPLAPSKNYSADPYREPIE